MTSLLDLKAQVDGLFVLETHDVDAYLGELLLESDFVTVEPGTSAGHLSFAWTMWRRVVPAAEHPDVVVAHAS